MNVSDAALLGSIIASLVTLPAASYTVTGDAAAAPPVPDIGGGNDPPTRTVARSGPEGTLRRVETPQGTATFETADGEFRMRLESALFTVTARQSAGARVRTIEAPGARIEVRETPRNVTEVCSTSAGTVRIVEAGETVERAFSGRNRSSVVSTCSTTRGHLEDGLQRLAGIAAEQGLVSRRVAITAVDPEAESVTISNEGPVPADMANWTLSDASGTSHQFGALALEPGETVTVYSGDAMEDCSPMDGSHHIRCWTSSSLWNDGGDTATLSRGDTAVDTYQYGE